MEEMKGEMEEARVRTEMVSKALGTKVLEETGKMKWGLSPKELSGKSRIVLQCEMSLTGSCV